MRALGAAVIMVALQDVRPAEAQLEPTLDAEFDSLLDPNADIPQAIDVRLPIEVPSFHGVEPALALEYTGAPYELAGTGWALRGLPVIERRSQGRGGPNFVASDVYVLDDQELLPCGPGVSSPSCTTGGTHFRRHESYERIAYSATSNSWAITSRSGTRTLLEPISAVATTASTTQRWGIRRVTDTHGNTVEYAWSCSSGPACVPATVRYGGVSVTIYSEPRADAFWIAGSGLTLQSSRIRTIQVGRDGAGTLRVYALTYDDNASNTASLVTRVTEYGRDAVVATDGRVTAGTALPAHRMTYNSDGASFAANSGHAPATGMANGFLDTRASTNTFADVDGDGRRDFITYDSLTGVWGFSVKLFDGTSFVSASHLPLPAGAGSSLVGGTNALADFNGDGRTDLLTYDTVGGAGYSLFLSDGTSFVRTSHLARLTGGSNCLSGSCSNAVTDLDGDGSMDLLLYENAPPALPRWVVFRSSGTGFVRGSALQVPSGASELLSGTNAISDFDGDGRADVLTWDTAATVIDVTSRGFTLWRYDGTDFVGDLRGRLVDASIADSCLDAAPCRNALVDVNGDGRTDLVTKRTGAGRHFDVRLSNGGGFWTSGSFTLSGAYGDQLAGATNAFADVSGDGLADLVAYRAGGGGWLVYLSDGGTLSAVSSATLATPGLYSGYLELGTTAPTNALADVNGDGRADLVTYDSDGGWGYTIWLSTGSSFVETSHVLPPSMYAGYLRGSSNQLADIDGDLKVDLVTYDSRTGRWGYTVHPIGGGPANALVSLTSPLGGVTSFTYSPARMVGPGGSFVIPRVASVRRDDGRGSVATIGFRYEGGRYHGAERRSLGFAREIATDASGSYRETTYSQTLAGAGMPLSTAFRDSSGRQVWASSYVYSEATAPPYAARVRTRTDLECAPGAACRERRVEFTYDAYNNVTEARDLGDVAVAGDERTSAVGFTPNTAAFVVDRPNRSRTFRGLGTSGTRLTETRFFYDDARAYTDAPVRGDPTRRDEWLDRTGAYLRTTMTYDAFGNRLTTTNAAGARTTTTYDAVHHVFPTRVCNALAHCTSTTWDTVLGLPLDVTDPNDFRTSYAYDPNGRLVRLTHPSGGFEETLYASLGAPAAQYVETRASDGTADGVWKRIYVDGFGRTYEQRREGGYRQLTEYEPEFPERVRRQSAWFGGTETPQYESRAYDAFGRLTSATLADGSIRTRTYGLGSVTYRDERSNERTELTTIRGLRSVVREHDGAATYDTAYAYDALDRMVSVTDAAGNRSTLTYDSLGRLTRGCDADRGCRSYAHNPMGSVVSQTDALGQTISFTYDALERVLSRTRPGASVDTFTYDEAGHSGGVGRVTTRSYPGGYEDTEYDFAGRETLRTLCRGAVCATIERTFDTSGIGRLASVVYPDETVTYTYNAAGELATVPGYVTSAAYNARGAPTRVAFANGTTTTFSYDAARHRLTSQAVRRGTTAIYDASYVYNADSTVRRWTVTNGGAARTLDYGYDALDRLTSVSGADTQTLAYDRVGNLTSNSLVGAYAYAAAHPHAAVTAGPHTYDYDANGNMLSGAGRTFAWDAEGRLASVTTGTGTSTFEYDPEGLRISQTSGGATTLYFGDLLEYEGGSFVKYVFAGSLRVARRVGLGTKHFYHLDHLGSPRAITDAGGTVVRQTSYRAFGDVSSESGSYVQPIGFTEQHRDAAPGLVYMNARYYDPVLSRFLSADSVVPTANPQDLNRYAYVRNSPLRYTDPSGREPYTDGHGHVVGGGGGYSDTGGGAGCRSNCGGSGGNGGGSSATSSGGARFRPAVPGDDGMMTPGSRVQTHLDDGTRMPGSGPNGYGPPERDYQRVEFHDWGSGTIVADIYDTRFDIYGAPPAAPIDRVVINPGSLTPYEADRIEIQADLNAQVATGAMTNQEALAALNSWDAQQHLGPGVGRGVGLAVTTAVGLTTGGYDDDYDLDRIDR